MDLEAFGSIGDFVGGLGVIASLIHLAMQIRQNTLAACTLVALVVLAPVFILVGWFWQ